MQRSWRQIRSWLLAAGTLILCGCELDSYFDPSRTGRFEHQPTTIPILDRIDVIERAPDPWAKATPVTPDDLIPADLVYRIAPADLITVEIFELLAVDQIWVSSRRVDAGGYFRLPSPIGDLLAAGFTPQEFQDEITRIVSERVMNNPLVNVVVEDGGAFTYTVYGATPGTGLYSLRRADMRLLDALAQAGGVAPNTPRIFVIRQIPLTEEVMPRRPVTRTPTQPKPPIDIEELIRQLDEGADQTPPSTPQTQDREPVDIESLLRQLDEPTQDTGADGEGPPGPNVNNAIYPALLLQETGPTLDIEELEPLTVPPPPVVAPPSLPPAAMPHETPAAPLRRPSPPGRPLTYVYDQERDEWVPVQVQVAPDEEEYRAPDPMDRELFVERIIEIPFAPLKHGQSSYNIVVRPGDRIYVEEMPTGVVYIDGEIVRPGVYNLPPSGRLTLSRLVAAAGGPGPLAWPSRVDLTRIVAENREATIRLSLGAIRQRTQPDLYLKPDDHIIMGTSFLATPFAVFRNGLRMTYGFGFLLDRNFGNDVFGAPPSRLRGS